MKNPENINNYISEIYQKMIFDTELILHYKLGDVGILRIFGEPFVAKNKYNFKLIINGKNYELSSIIKIIDIETGKKSNKVIKGVKRFFLFYLEKKMKKILNQRLKGQK